MTVDAHRLAEERSIEYHRAVAARLPARPDLIAAARARLRDWIAAGGRSAPYAGRWLEVLDQPLASVCALLVDPGEEARALRQCTPFAGVIDPRQRWRIWREVRERLEARP